jgi:hypothetical protein
VRDALDAMSWRERAKMFEASAAALDQRPVYVDELYAVARHHPRMFDRFLVNTTHDLRVENNARRTAATLMRDPDAFEQMMMVALELVQHDRVARSRLVRAMVRKRAIVADLLTDRPDALVHIMNATLRRVLHKPKARAGVRTSLEQSSKAVAPVLIEDPGTLGELMKALIDAGLDVEDTIKTLEQPEQKPEPDQSQPDPKQR